MQGCGGKDGSQIALKLWADIDDLQAHIPNLTQEIRDLGVDLEVMDVEVANATAAPSRIRRVLGLTQEAC